MFSLIFALLAITYGQDFDIAAEAPGQLISFTSGEVTCSADDTSACDALDLTCDTSTNLCAIACTTDSDCTDYADGTGLTVCDTSTGLCDSPDTCSDDADCPTVIGSTCDTSSGSCSDPVSCSHNSNCTQAGVGYCDGGMCSPETCSAGCISDNYVCSDETGYCVESCETSGLCDGSLTLTCNTDTGMCETECTEDADCTGTTNTCETTTGTCYITCTTDQNCTDVGLPATTCTSGSCVPSVDDIDITGCSSDTDCDTDTPTCDTTTGTCYYGCNEEGECTESGYECADSGYGYSTCVEVYGGSCSTDNDCEGDSICVPVGDVGCAAECSSDSDCQDLGLNNPCKTQTLDLGITSQSFKYCDISETPGPTMAPIADGVHRIGVLMVVGYIIGMVMNM